MKAEAQKYIFGIFANANHLSTDSTSDKVKGLIAHACAPFYLWSECLPVSEVAHSPNPIDGLLITMATRLYGTVSGLLSLLAIGRPQEAEILSRTVMESAFSLLYVIEKNTGERLLQFFEMHINTERKQNAGWEKSLADQPAEVTTDHKVRIVHKNNMLDVMEQFLGAFSKEIGIQFPSKKTYPPSMAAVSEALGRPIEYRTVYAAMCSQSHHDAEDILNDLMVGTLKSPEATRSVENERNNFSIYLVCMSLHYYLECMNELGLRYKFKAVSDQAEKSTEAVMELAQSVSNDLICSTKAWMSV